MSCENRGCDPFQSYSDKTNRGYFMSFNDLFSQHKWTSTVTFSWKITWSRVFVKKSKNTHNRYFMYCSYIASKPTFAECLSITKFVTRVTKLPLNINHRINRNAWQRFMISIALYSCFKDSSIIKAVYAATNEMKTFSIWMLYLTNSGTIPTVNKYGTQILSILGYSMIGVKRADEWGLMQMLLLCK